MSQLCISGVKALCLIRMSGIVKTTITKAIFNNLKHTYNASCFVDCIEGSGDCYKTSCYILEKLQVKSKQKDLEEFQEMLKLFLTINKVILIFDDVRNESQIEDVLHMDDLIASNGSILIIVIWHWKAMEYFKTKIYKINVEEFNKEIILKLFI